MSRSKSFFKNVYTGVLISPWPDKEGNKLMFLSDDVNFLRRLALQEKKLDFVENPRVPDMLPSLFPSWSG